MNAESFSSHQVQRLLSRHRLSKCHDELSKQLTKQEALRQFKELNLDLVNVLEADRIEEAFESDQATAMRIQSQDQGHTLLIKLSPMKSKIALPESKNLSSAAE